MTSCIDKLTFGEIKELVALFGNKETRGGAGNPLVGRRVLVRTYSAGVHVGYLKEANGSECLLENSLRLWKWEGGGLSLSSVANNGIKGGRLNKTGEVFLTNAIEFIPTTEDAEKTFVEFIED